MKIYVHSEDGRSVGVAEVDAAAPPPVVRVVRPDGQSQECFLDWDRAFDDEHHLRKCPVCSCEMLYRKPVLPPLTGFIVVLVAGLVSLLLWGLNTTPLWLLWAAIGVIVAANIVIYLAGPEMLVCYRCQSRFGGVKISAGQGGWDAGAAQKHKPPATISRPASS